jgi:glutathione S-transferase
MADIVLYEFKRTRSEKCRWALREAGLPYRSEGNSPRTIGSEDVRKIHPLGKLPAALIDGKPLFESVAIVNAVADLAPEKDLIPKPGSWERTLHDQWSLFIATEVEAWAWSGFLNKSPFLLAEENRRPDVLEQSRGFFKNGAKVLEDRLGKMDYMLRDRFGVTDIIASAALVMGRMTGYLDDGFPNLNGYLDRLSGREYCPFKPIAAAVT